MRIYNNNSIGTTLNRNLNYNIRCISLSIRLLEKYLVTS